MKKFIYAALAATILLASCAKDGNEGIKNEEGPQTSMGISFTMPKVPGTRATTGDPVVGTADENRFTNLRVFVFKSNGTAAEGNNLRAYTDTDFNETAGTFTMKATSQIKTTAGEKNVYVGLNLPSYFDNITTEQELKDAMSFVANDMVTASGAAMMSDVITKVLVTQEDGSTTNPANEVSVSLERMVAKVVAHSVAPNYTTTHNGISITYNIKKWGIGQGTNLMYPSRQYVGGNLVTPRTASGDPAVNPHPGKTDLLGVDIKPTVADNELNTLNHTYVGENVPKDKLKGEATYAMVQATFSPNQKAVLNGDETAVVLAAHTFVAGTDDIWVVRAGGVDYFCATEDDANKVGGFLALTSSNVTYQLYEDSYVYFVVWLNKDIAGKEAIVERNQFIHLQITGVKEGVFGGLPGEGPGDVPPDPFDPGDPTEPDPFDPKDPIFETESHLYVKFDIKPWVYVANPTVLE